MRCLPALGLSAIALLLHPMFGDGTGLDAHVGAQLSTELPGVPSPGVPTFSRSRSEWALEGAVSWDPPDENVRRFIQSRLALGRSFRILRNGEVGINFTFLDATALVPEEGQDPPNDATRWDGSVAYALTLGAKYRFLSLIDLDGYGFEAAVLGTWRLGAEPAFRMIRQGDEIRDSSGLLAGEQQADSEEGLASPPEVPFRQSFGLVGGVRQPRWMADIAVTRQSTPSVDNPWLETSEGTTLRIGVMGRLSSTFSLGVAWWGSGDPPWGNTPLRPDGGRNESTYGLVFSLDERRGGGTRLMLSSPTGSPTQSLRLYILSFRSR